MEAQYDAFEEQRLRQLASEGAEVYTVEHENKHDPWPFVKIRGIMQQVASQMEGTEHEELDDFKFRRALLENNEEMRRFKKDHLNLFMMVTDREKMRDRRYRGAVEAILTVHLQVERGEISAGRDADATATRAVIAALQGNP